MSQAAMIEVHKSLQLLVDIPGAFSDGTGAARATSVCCNEYNSQHNHHPQIEFTHRRALRRIERALASLLEAGLGGKEMMETDQQNQDESSLVIWLADDNNDNTNSSPAKPECTNSTTATQSAASETEILETLKDDLVAVLHGLCLSEDEVKRELAESCINAASQAVVSFKFMLSGDNIVSILNRLLLTDADNQNIQALLLWVLNKQFEEGLRISSESIAVLASFEVLEIVTKDFSPDCLVEDLESIHRSWYTLAGHMIQFSIPDQANVTSPGDLRLWLVERIAEGVINGAAEDMASLWMMNACQFVTSIANFALDALDSNNKQQAVYHATLTYQIMACLNSAFDDELQSTVSRLWMTLVSSNLKETSDFMDNEVQYTITSLSLDLYGIIRDRDETTTILLFMRSLEFPDLVGKHSHLFTVIPKRTLQCVMLTLLRQQPVEHVLTEQILEKLILMKCDGDLMDAFFWRQVDAALHQHNNLESG
jgi:hypothetical protein